MEILVNENEEFDFVYTKVADYENGKFVLKEPYCESGVNLNDISEGINLRKATEILTAYEADGVSVRTKNQVAQIGVLSEGVYLIEGVSNADYKISPTLVSIPRWDEGEELSYQVTVIPKIERRAAIVETGDSVKVTPLIGLCCFSLVIVIGIAGKVFFLKDK